MSKFFGILCVVCLAGVASCDAFEDPVEEDTDTGADTGSDSDADNDADSDSDNDADGDADTDSDPIQYDSIELCSVEVEFAYYSNGEVFEVTLTNNNAITAMVLIQNLTTGGMVAKSCLWPAGSIGTGEGGDEDVVDVSYEYSDDLFIDVRLLSGWGYEATCDPMFDTYFESEATACATTEY